MWSSKVNESQAYKLNYLKTHSASLDWFRNETKSSKKKKKEYICTPISYTCTYRENFMEMWVFWDRAICGMAFIISRHLEVPFPKEICFLSIYKPKNKLRVGE